MSLNVSYKGNTIYTLSENAIAGDTENLSTAGKYCDADIVINCTNGLFPERPGSEYSAAVIETLDRTKITRLVNGLTTVGLVKVRYTITMANDVDMSKLTFKAFLTGDTTETNVIVDPLEISGQQVIVYCTYPSASDYTNTIDFYVLYDNVGIGGIRYGAGGYVRSNWNSTSNPLNTIFLRSFWAYAVAANNLWNT